MGESALLLARVLKLLAEIALMGEVGRAALGGWLGSRRAGNPVHGVFRVVTSPLRWVAAQLGASTPGRQALLAVALAAVVWVAAFAWKVSLCLSIGLRLCR